MKLLPLALFATLLPAPAMAQAARSFAAAGFDRIALRGCDNVVVTPGAGFAVRAQGAAGSLAAIGVAVRGGVLTITRAPGSCDSRAGTPAATIAITLPALRALEASGTGSVRTGRIAGPAFEARLGGTGDLTIAGLQAQRVMIDRAGTGTATLHGVRAGRLSLALGGTGRIVADGHADALAITAGGTGHVDTSTLTTGGLSVRASGTGSVRAQAGGPAAVDASGIARVTVTGRAQCAVNRSGLARVTCG